MWATEHALTRLSPVRWLLEDRQALHASELSGGMLHILTEALRAAVNAVVAGTSDERTRAGLHPAEAENIRHMIRVGHRLGVGEETEQALYERGGSSIRTALVDATQTAGVLETIYRRSGGRDRKIVRRLLSHPDTPVRLHRELAEEAVIRAAHVPGPYPTSTGYAADPKAEREHSAGRSGNRDLTGLAHDRLAKALKVESEYLYRSIGDRRKVTSRDVIGVLEDAELRQLLARLIRHRRNMIEVRASGSPGRAERAEVLFARSWNDATEDLRRKNADILSVEKADSQILDGDDRTEAGEDAAPARRAGRLAGILGTAKADSQILDGDDRQGADGDAVGLEAATGRKSSSRKTASRLPGMPCPCTAPLSTANAGSQRDVEDARPPDRLAERRPESSRPPYEAQPATGPWAASEQVEARASEIIRLLSRRPITVETCDAVGVEVWSDGALLTEILARHHELPDRALAGMKRASVRTGGHRSPHPPVDPEHLLSRLGAGGTAELLGRLRGVRVQWPEGERPPRYIRHPTSRVEWRTAARFLVHEGSEASWLLGEGTGVGAGAGEEGPGAFASVRGFSEAAAKCVMMLGVETLAELPEVRLAEVLYAAGGYDLERVASAVTAARLARSGLRWDAAGIILGADLTAAETEVAFRLIEGWGGTLQELVDLSKVL